MKRKFEVAGRQFSVLVVSTLVSIASAQQSPLNWPASSGRTNLAQHDSPGTLLIPESSQPQTPQSGQPRTAHTNIQVFIPANLSSEVSPPFTGYAYETPSSLACVYGLTATGAPGLTATGAPACNPNNTALPVPTGGSKTIAIVDAYDDPEAEADLAWFSLQFGIPLKTSQFQVIRACDPMQVDITGGWELEESLDIEYAHAMAPNAKLYLVEACSNQYIDLLSAVLIANNLVKCGQTTTCPAGSTGRGEVSMSWGGAEFADETTLDSYFSTPGIVYVASSGDAPGAAWPGASPNVVSAGGLTIRRNMTTGNFISQTGWVTAGAGQSNFETQPSYQARPGVQGVCGTSWRCVPDLSFDADPYTGVWVYDTFPFYAFEYGNWFVVGGTSVSAPALAGIFNRAGRFAGSSKEELVTIYNNMANTSDFTDVRSAWCGHYMGFAGKIGWDLCTGVGAVKGYHGK